jgi:ribosomal protein L29
MLENIIKAMKDHKEVYADATATYLKTRKQCDENFKDRYRQQKIDEAYQIQNDTIRSSRETALAACTTTFDEIRNKANAVVTMPVSGDLQNTLELLKALKNPSKAELEALMEQYKENYFAYRAISDALGGKENGYRVATIDDIMDACAELEATVRKCLYDVPGAYMYRLLIQPDSKYVANYDALFTAFIDGRFEDATVIDEQQQETEE